MEIAAELRQLNQILEGFLPPGLEVARDLAEILGPLSGFSVPAPKKD